MKKEYYYTIYNKKEKEFELLPTEDNVPDYMTFESRKEAREYIKELYKDCKKDFQIVKQPIVRRYEDISKIYKHGTKCCDGKIKHKYKKILNNLNDNFYQKFYEALVKVFPYLKDPIISDDDSDEYLEWNSSTAGWNDAMVSVLGKKYVDYMYKGLDWYDCDFLDGEIEVRLSAWYIKQKKFQEGVKKCIAKKN